MPEEDAHLVSDITSDISKDWEALVIFAKKGGFKGPESNLIGDPIKYAQREIDRLYKTIREMRK